MLDNSKNLGAELLRARKAKGFTLRYVQTKTGISNAYLSQLETGKAESPSPPMLHKLAKLYQIPYEAFLRAAAYLENEVATRDIFLSHRSTDNEFVAELAADIESESHDGRALRTWLDEAEVAPGQSLPRMINEGLEKSRFIAVIMTPQYFESPSGWTDAEWHAALQGDPDNRSGRILPLLVQDCPYIPYLLRHLRAIDLRGPRYQHGLRELLSVLKQERLPRPISHRGQLITTGRKIDRSTLVAERAVPDADPDVITESLYCNLLPIEGLPRYIYMASIDSSLMKKGKARSQGIPSKTRLKEAIRSAQEAAGIELEHRFMPAFRLFEDKIITFHDLEGVDGPLSAVIDENEIEIHEISSFVRDEDLRQIVVSLMNMALDRHLFRAGLVVDNTKLGRYFFPAKEGGTHSITWTPRRKKAVRTVAKPLTRDGTVIYWRHLGAYLRVIFLVNKFYIKVTPTWVLTEDGLHPAGGPSLTKQVIKWTGPERNLQVLFHVRFWTSVLRRRQAGPISIWAGDQMMEIATVPAMIQQSYGIARDQRDLMRLLDEEAPIIAAEEEELAEIVLENELTEEEIDYDPSYDAGFDEEVSSSEINEAIS